MFQELIEFLKNKKIAILGFGLEGRSTYEWIRKNLPEQQVTIIDKNENIEEKIKQDKYINFVFGEKYLENLEKYDLIFKTPGISLKNIEIEKIKEKIISQLQMFLKFFKGKTIGVTGTKGKSTTSSLIYEVIKQQNDNTILLGNIGIPIFNYLDKINEKTIVVLEISSHQLEFVKKSPNISVFLNVYEEHLDHYKSYKDYAKAKFNIMKYQKEEDIAIYNFDNEIIKNMLKQEKVISKKIPVSLKEKLEDGFFIEKENVFYNDEKIYNINDERKLLGAHNLFDIICVLAVCKKMNLNMNLAIEIINEFQGLPHRMEFVGEFNNIKYYNDSIATIPEATINCIKALKEVDTLILGGLDRGINYNKLVDFLNETNINNIICLPDTGYFIADQINNKKTYKTIDIKEAVDIAKKVTEKGKICLLSPAAASYGFFKNFQERGEIFKKCVKES